MFINISNHPLNVWGLKQLQAASEYDEDKIDMPFPYIPGEAGSEEIDRLVEKYYTEVISYAHPVVMLQGEFVFTYRLVHKLKEAGITVLSACSERMVETRRDEKGNYIKTSGFSFVRFREY